MSDRDHLKDYRDYMAGWCARAARDQPSPSMGTNEMYLNGYDRGAGAWRDEDQHARFNVTWFGYSAAIPQPTPCPRKARDYFTPTGAAKPCLGQAQGARVWAFRNAPREYRLLSMNGGDEDWVVFIPDGWKDKYGVVSSSNGPADPDWAREGSQFGPCSVDEYRVDGGWVLIGCHA